MKIQLSMDELKNVKKNGYNVVSTFSGAGGNSMGYLKDGYTIKMALDFDPEASETYRENFPTTDFLECDIRNVTGEDILNRIGLKKYELDVFDGSPPCAAFSTQGKIDKGWGKIKEYSGTQQRVDDLFFEYLRIIAEIKPKVFIAENVKGLTQGKSKIYLKAILDYADKIGYNTEAKVLNSCNYGVPQARERTIFIGVRKDLNLNPVYPKPYDYVITTKEAIEEFIDDGTDAGNFTPLQIKRFTELGFEATAKQVHEYAIKNGISIFESNWHRDYWNKPSRTIVAQGPRLAHPLRNRYLSLKEGKRLQSFPDDYILKHNATQNWERIGRSAPPNLLYAVSKTVREEILEKQKATVESAKLYFGEDIIPKPDFSFLDEIVKTNGKKEEKKKMATKTIKEVEKERPCENKIKDELNFNGAWVFDEKVTGVFTDMISRSIPGYQRMRENCFNIGKHFVKAETGIVELGCSNGLSIKPFVEHFDDNNLFYLYDNSEPMIKEAKELFKNNPSVKIECADIQNINFSNNISLAMSIFTLQFVPIEYRDKIIQKIYNSLNPGGAFVYAEKVLCNDVKTEELFETEYYAMKANNGYSTEQIMSKKKSLENRLVPLKLDWHYNMLKDSGFKSIDVFWKDLMFTGIVAIK